MTNIQRFLRSTPRLMRLLRRIENQAGLENSLIPLKDLVLHKIKLKRLMSKCIQNQSMEKFCHLLTDTRLRQICTIKSFQNGTPTRTISALSKPNLNKMPHNLPQIRPPRPNRLLLRTILSNLKQQTPT